MNISEYKRQIIKSVECMTEDDTVFLRQLLTLIRKHMQKHK